jgi:hypothetical protein
MRYNEEKWDQLPLEVFKIVTSVGSDAQKNAMVYTLKKNFDPSKSLGK